MKPVNLSMPGYQVNEYQLVLLPHEDLRERINKIKTAFAEKFKAPNAKFTKPHLGLVSFLSLGMMEERILQRLQAIAMGITPFKLEIKNYGSYPSHTIFFDVITRLPVQHLVSELKQAQRLMKLNQENKPHFFEDPHITLCMKLKPWQYEQGWLEFSHRQFTGRFIADAMLLLKRPAEEKGDFQILKRFEFMNLPVATKQGNLFV
jgi:2'-5' RNA ligase